MPFGRLFDRAGRRRRAAVEGVYDQVLAAARDPWLYDRAGVPDTFDGRFEMMVWHLAPITLRLRHGDASAKAFSQDLFDRFLDDMEKAMREAGVGDIAIPKRLQKMVRVWFGLVRAFEDIEAAGATAASMRPVLERNLLKGEESVSLDALAERLAETWQRVEATAIGEIVQGAVPFEKEQAA